VHQQLRTPRLLTDGEIVRFSADAKQGKKVDWSDEEEAETDEESIPDVFATLSDALGSGTSSIVDASLQQIEVGQTVALS